MRGRVMRVAAATLDGEQLSDDRHAPPKQCGVLLAELNCEGATQ
jgi:hypothetical protein